MINKNQVLEIFNKAGALLEGHFLLTSGKHSKRYLQCAKVFENTKYSQFFCKELAERFKNEDIDLVVGPAVGAIQMAYEVSRWLNARNIFTERENGQMLLRRNFTIEKGQNVLVVEDVITTGGSVKEVIDIVKDNGGNIKGVAVIVDRSNGLANFNTRLESIISMNIETFTKEECPLCKNNIPLVKPGSRKNI